MRMFRSLCFCLCLRRVGFRLRQPQPHRPPAQRHQLPLPPALRPRPRLRLHHRRDLHRHLRLPPAHHDLHLARPPLAQRQRQRRAAAHQRALWLCVGFEPDVLDAPGRVADGAVVRGEQQRAVERAEWGGAGVGWARACCGGGGGGRGGGGVAFVSGVLNMRIENAGRVGERRSGACCDF
ncbi:hypothetical protein C8R47DRAFT_1129879 [Mycena vitilis]|nr:hypothetical protein C8R47DRAFT_1129879 [Mycena vitilis]